jgi:hypothetical protein
MTKQRRIEPSILEKTVELASRTDLDKWKRSDPDKDSFESANPMQWDYNHVGFKISLIQGNYDNGYTNKYILIAGTGLLDSYLRFCQEISINDLRQKTKLLFSGIAGLYYKIYQAEQGNFLKRKEINAEEHRKSTEETIKTKYLSDRVRRTR